MLTKQKGKMYYARKTHTKGMGEGREGGESWSSQDGMELKSRFLIENVFLGSKNIIWHTRV